MATAQKTPKRRISGFCNPTLPRTEQYDPHTHCPGCDCDAPGCHCRESHVPTSGPPTAEYIQDLVRKDAERHAVFWTDSAGVPQMTPGWETENDAATFLEVLILHHYIDLDGEMDVRTYVGECPW